MNFKKNQKNGQKLNAFQMESLESTELSRDEMRKVSGGTFFINPGYVYAWTYAVQNAANQLVDYIAGDD